MDSDDVKAGLILFFVLLIGFFFGMLARQGQINDARTEGSRSCTRQQPGYVRQSVAACIQEVQQKAQRCQELSLEMR